MDSVGAARAAVLTRATSTAPANSCCPGRRLAASYRAGFYSSPRLVVAGKGVLGTNPTRLRALRGVRMRRAPRTPAVPLHAVGAPELAPDPHYWDRTPVQEHLPAHITGTHNELHVHPVVDLVVRAPMIRLVVLRFFPRRYSGNIVAPVGVARRRVVVARPF